MRETFLDRKIRELELLAPEPFQATRLRSSQILDPENRDRGARIVYTLLTLAAFLVSKIGLGHVSSCGEDPMTSTIAETKKLSTDQYGRYEVPAFTRIGASGFGGCAAFFVTGSKKG
jgi:hypothetical protein